MQGNPADNLAGLSRPTHPGPTRTGALQTYSPLEGPTNTLWSHSNLIHRNRGVTPNADGKNKKQNKTKNTKTSIYTERAAELYLQDRPAELYLQDRPAFIQSAPPIQKESRSSRQMETYITKSSQLNASRSWNELESNCCKQNEVPNVSDIT